MESTTTAIKVGIVTLLGLVLIGLVTVWKTEIFTFRKGYQLVATFENIEGLTVGSELRFRGLKVGKVLRIDPGPYDIKVFAVVDPDIKIPSDSILRVAYDGIVGMKFLEIKPGTAEAMYAAPAELQGLRTASLVDFIDIGAKNLMETKAILESVRRLIDDPQLQQSVRNAVFAAERLTEELRQTTAGIKSIVADPTFQANVKGTIGETNKTLTSANSFFEGISKINLRASGGVDYGNRANAVRGDVDIIQNEKSYLRFGIGEGPTRTMSVLDLLLTNTVSDRYGYRLGVINNQLGGGLIVKSFLSGYLLSDIYDINNPKPNNPKIRFGYEREVQPYMDLMLQADDVLNSGNRNYMLGIRVKNSGDKLY